jgi:putative phosphoesterase
MLRFAAVSDIHGNLPAIESAAADITARGIATVVNLGDNVSGPLWPKETAKFLMSTGWIHIAGNHDRTVLDADLSTLGASDQYARKHIDQSQLQWLRSLVRVAEWKEGLLLCHGTPTDDMSYLADTVEHERLRRATPGELTDRLRGMRARIILCGHSHSPRVVHSANSTVIINPGSVGLQAYRDDGALPHVVECGSPHARYAVVTIDNEACSVDHIALPYDHRSAARQARKNGRPEWAVALETGFMASEKNEAERA